MPLINELTVDLGNASELYTIVIVLALFRTDTGGLPSPTKYRYEL